MNHANLTESENRFLSHNVRWGSDMYPAQKAGSRWMWAEFCGVKGSPVIYKTKRECVAAIEAYIEMLCDKAAGRLG
jgi:hypothetical protein